MRGPCRTAASQILTPQVLRADVFSGDLRARVGHRVGLFTGGPGLRFGSGVGVGTRGTGVGVGFGLGWQANSVVVASRTWSASARVPFPQRKIADTSGTRASDEQSIPAIAESVRSPQLTL